MITEGINRCNTGTAVHVGTDAWNTLQPEFDKTTERLSAFMGLRVPQLLLYCFRIDAICTLFILLLRFC